ncbi:16S rRNA (uracil1498-N3)-methyltransferase [Enterococcus sp. PF1-24]|uniref:16S rRNA (uracil(1498)-N(3))-methyltransferase n=1 Tax=unclassified Enterococcus TaxID=2608891 RepID=UPI0024732BA1|nr:MULTISPECIES: 16S rRNA (uracil(1498)-N(3))-methyltransferase [unclassified Enterococcus]MDH6365085.1 16S rRNA (uracil1498-N3)-methyltransferase [Enterococcus sp. PFB1-1]MDH6402142.1 16S rRNA (uracil1498-N3)-methyltransferase [Enterococcus sp. PF1-24]
MQRYFIEEKYQPQVSYQLTGENFHHIVRVMRMQPDEEVYLVFSDQVSIIAAISQITEEAVWLKEIRREQQNKELPVELTIACAFPKGDKLEWVIQKGTELGAQHFMAFPGQTSVAKWDEKKLAKKEQRYQKIAQEAAEQSQRQYAPKITLFANQKKWLQQLSQFDYIVVAYEESAKQGEQANLVKILQQAQPGEKIVAIFGPEGGLTPKEIEELNELGGVCCGLGPRILRAETAPLYFLSAASYQLELLKK